MAVLVTPSTIYSTAGGIKITGRSGRPAVPVNFSASSSAMAAALLTMFVPADIVYAILDELSSDPTSLKQCSLVAHSFRTHCHKLLFSHIVLNHPRQSRGLHRAISVNAALAGHIRSVEVVSTVADEFRGREWVTIEHTLAPLLQTLHSLQAFVFRSTCLPPLQWTSLPAELRQAILEISAPSITLRTITGVPMEPFGRLAGLRRLCLMWTASDSPSTASGNSPSPHETSPPSTRTPSGRSLTLLSRGLKCTLACGT
ncbi:hypothetical protein LshimejAT787_2400440 [Lyophyllum shimeji]|uniref:Uncharacterized protein n=1 Tax=Lyophyllum shimeji TaxID=47721 RepID=A0A9P3Q2P7_LYOSH|nr:hypothetical protein LshimejAT787_2400440 [Lyophyllum shimeji]